MSDNELISVIVPIYNVEEYIKKCIDSIINQSYKNIEILLIDDGSTDKSGIICEKYREIDKRIRVIHQSNKGLSNARNVGINKATGNLLSFVDGDDYVDKNYLKELKNNMDICKSDISICNYYRVKDNNIYIPYIFNNNFICRGKEKYNYLEGEFTTITTIAWNKLYKKKLFNNLKYPENKIFEDAYIICELLKNANIISYLNKPLYYYVYRSNSIVCNFSEKHFDKIAAYNKRIAFLTKCGYNNLVIEEKNSKILTIIDFLFRLKINGIDNNKIERKFYRELIDTCKGIKWNDSTGKVKAFKILRNNYILLKTIKYKVLKLLN